MLEDDKIPFLNFLTNYENFIIFGHKEPDADCIFSQLVLARILQKKNKQVILLNEGPFRRQEIVKEQGFFEQTVPTNWLSSDREKTALFLVDCSSLERVGEIINPYKDLPACVVDHHSSGNCFGNLRIIHPESPSTTLLIHILSDWLEVNLSLEEAQWILTGFITDTGFFRHLDESSSPWIKRVSDIISMGVSLRDLYKKLYLNKDFEYIEKLTSILKRVKRFCNDQVFITYQLKKDNKESSSFDSDILHQLLMMVDSCEVIVLMKYLEQDEKITVSMRSKSWVDVGKFALLYYGGGGHKHAAGFAVTHQSLVELEENLVGKLEKEFNKNF